ncbi:MAG: hypothetical protein JRG92_00225 [Deltaproteobacteria bacterium]|nr:hypothetical protein [Deltaproteobacteria bacterium]
MAKTDRPRVGEILLRAGVIDKHQLQAALGEQRRWGRRLGSTLIKMGFIEERALVRALASQLDLPVATLEGKRIHPEVLGLVPRAVAEKYMVIPLFVKKEGSMNCLFVGMEDPSSLDVLDELSFRSGMTVRPVLVGPSELAEAIDRYYCRDGEGDAEGDAEGAPLDETNPIVEAELSVDVDTIADPPAPPAPPVADGPSGTAELARFWAISENEEGDANDTTLPEGAGIDASAPTPAPVASPQPSAPSPPPALAPAQAAAPELAAPEPLIVHDRPDPPMPEIALDSLAPSTAPAPTPAPAPTQQAAPRRPAAVPPPASDAAMNARMRLVLQALTQLLIEKGLLTNDELHARVRDLQLMSGSDG